MTFDPDRRRFVTSLAALAGSAACGGASPGPDGSPAPGADAGLPAAQCPTTAAGPGMGYCDARGSGVVTRVVGASRLATGRAVLHDIDGDAAVFVARDARGLYALSAVCTHQCCIISLCGDTPACLHTVDDPGPGQVSPSAVLPTDGPAFHCICHNSAYDAAGVVVRGPSIRPLPQFAICVDGDDVVVDTSHVVPGGTRG